jgi:hypothetical protein
MTKSECLKKSESQMAKGDTLLSREACPARHSFTPARRARTFCAMSRKPLREKQLVLTISPEVPPTGE